MKMCQKGVHVGFEQNLNLHGEPQNSLYASIQAVLTFLAQANVQANGKCISETIAKYFYSIHNTRGYVRVIFFKSSCAIIAAVWTRWSAIMVCSSHTELNMLCGN